MGYNRTRKGYKMKAIIEMELEVDGEWQPGDKDLLIEAMFKNPHYGVWELDDERIAVLANSMTVEIVED